ncbi:hypothetical protein AAFF_G00266070 [Aldrovandia affinis]|uniref:Uncharacterized protein n=1 Tax=Aldrovandia affinis TaxID=143900 RepID=A0AAD7RBC4_9TELE|nr:hypothetical protein AAFF_G00266070 [Aldrovandia affinis]
MIRDLQDQTPNPATRSVWSQKSTHMFFSRSPALAVKQYSEFCSGGLRPHGACLPPFPPLMDARGAAESQDPPGGTAREPDRPSLETRRGAALTCTVS